MSAKPPALLAILALACAVSATSARADGDPASDVLATQDLFLPADAGLPIARQAQLAAVLQESARAGYPIRVALVASRADLGSVTALWRQPQTYAQFLGQELSLVYPGALLVVMPDGIGSFHVAQALRSSVVGARAVGGLAAAALTAIRSLAAAAGHPLALPSPSITRVGAAGDSAIPWIAFAAGAVLILASWTASLRARPLRLEANPREIP